MPEKSHHKAATQIPTLRSVDTAKDADALRELYVFSLRLNAKGFVQNLEFHGDIVQRAEKYQKNSGDMIGAFIDDKLIGFGGLSRIDEKNIELGKLHLYPEYQGQGIGRSLAETLLKRANALGYNTVKLHVTVTQEPAIKLYKKLGFQQTDRRMSTIGDETFDTIFMELNI